MKKEIKDLITIAESNGWSVDADGNEYTFSQYSPAGQDFSFSVTGETKKELLDGVKEYSESFDCSEEASLWLDSSGHGTNGAPYDMKDLYEDMEACAQMVDELCTALE
jgi:hypothetical protein